MSGREKKAHNLYCEYEIQKAKQPRIPKMREKKSMGIRTSNTSKAILVRQIASLM